MKTQALLVASVVTLTSLPGCIFLADPRDDPAPIPPAPRNGAPEILLDGTWWLCDWDEIDQDYFFEFQVEVWDADGDLDVADAAVTVYPADDPGYVLDSFSLFDEGDGIWAAIVWERETDLYCGEAIDVVYEAWDESGATDRIVEPY